MSLRTSYSLTVTEEELQVTNFDQCLHIVMVIGKCTDVFRGIFSSVRKVLRGGVYMGRSFHVGICHGRREFS